MRTEKAPGIIPPKVIVDASGQYLIYFPQRQSAKAEADAFDPKKASSAAAIQGPELGKAPRPTPTIRFWAGFKAEEGIEEEEFVRAIQKVLIPGTTKVGAGEGLLGYTPVLVSEGPDSLPDEIAMVAYYSQEHYQAIRQTPEGAAYGAHHRRLDGMENIPGAEDLEGKPLFAMPGRGEPRHSESATPVKYEGAVELHGCYSLFPHKYLDWTGSEVMTRIYQRNQDVSDYEYLDAMRAYLDDAQSSAAPSAHFVRVEGDYMVEYLFFDDHESLKNYSWATVDALPVVAPIWQDQRLKPLNQEESEGLSFDISRVSGYRLVFDPEIEKLQNEAED